MFATVGITYLHSGRPDRVVGRPIGPDGAVEFFDGCEAQRASVLCGCRFGSREEAAAHGRLVFEDGWAESFSTACAGE